ncbi:MAG: hypothetical protein Q8N99_08930 [Nanoarchaeota archaeon]|nr:hypothetical protein [Nanoarchaeota archaeon]
MKETLTDRILESINFSELDSSQSKRLRELATDLGSCLQGQPVLNCIGYAFEYRLPDDVSQDEKVLQPLFNAVSKLGPYIQVCAAKQNPEVMRLEGSGVKGTGSCGDGPGPSQKVVRY